MQVCSEQRDRETGCVFLVHSTQGMSLFYCLHTIIEVYIYMYIHVSKVMNRAFIVGF